MENRGVETAEQNNDAATQGSAVNQSLLSGALKSGSSQRPEKVKRASAVRFADQINNIDQEENMTRKSIGEQSSGASGSGKPNTRVSGMQIVGSQEIEAARPGNRNEPSLASPELDDLPPRDRSRLTEDHDSVNRDHSSRSGSESEEGEEEGDEVDSVKMRNREKKKLKVETGPAEEPGKNLLDQKIIEVDYGPLHDMKIAVDEKVFLSRISDMGSRPEDTAEFIIDFFRAKDKQQVKLPGKQKPMPADFTRAERNLIHCIFKKVISQKRVMLRIIMTVLENPKYQRFRTKVQDYQKKIKEELITDCNYFMDMIHSYCIDRTGNLPESEVFFITLVADLTRYIAEQTPPGPRLKDLKESIQQLYERAERKAVKLHYCSPTKMQRDLHHANFEHEFMSNTEKAIKICEQSVLMAHAMLGNVPDEIYVEATHLQELLKENVAIWRGQDPTSVNQNGFD